MRVILLLTQHLKIRNPKNSPPILQDQETLKIMSPRQKHTHTLTEQKQTHIPFFLVHGFLGAPTGENKQQKQSPIKSNYWKCLSPIACLCLLCFVLAKIFCGKGAVKEPPSKLSYWNLCNWLFAFALFCVGTKCSFFRGMVCNIRLWGQCLGCDFGHPC